MTIAPTIRQEGPDLYVELPGRLTAATAADCYRAIQHAAHSGSPTRIVVDVQPVEQWDPTGLAVLRATYRLCLRRNVVWELRGDRPELTNGVRAVTTDASLTQIAMEPVASLPLMVGHRTIELLHEIRQQIAFIGGLLIGLFQAALHPSRVRWRDTFFYMDRCATDALPITVLICFLMGLILGFQSAIQLHQFGADRFVADLVGLSIVRELGPLMVAMICTGRAGSAFAAEIGTMKVSEEVDALVTMGLEPTRFLVIPKVVALMAMMPLLTIFGDLMGVFGGFLVGTVKLGIPWVAYSTRTMEALAPLDIGEGLAKSVVFALLVGAVGCMRGLQAENSAQAVGKSTTSAVVSGIFLVVVADTMMTFLFSQLRG